MSARWNPPKIEVWKFPLGAVVLAILALAAEWSVAQDPPADATGDTVADELGIDFGGPGDRMDPEVKIAFDKGMQLMGEQKFAEAISQFSRAVDLNPNSPQPYFERAQAFVALKEHDLAIRSFAKAIRYGRGSPALFQVYNGRGQVYLTLGQFREAVDDFSAAVELRPGDPELLYSRGSALVRLGSQQRASGIATSVENLAAGLASLDRAIQVREDYPEAYFDRASVRTEFGQLDEAIDDMRKAAELDSENSEYLVGLGFAQLQQGGQKAVASGPRAAEAAADYEDAIESFKKAIDILRRKIEQQKLNDMEAAAGEATGGTETEEQEPDTSKRDTEPSDIGELGGRADGSETVPDEATESDAGAALNGEPAGSRVASGETEKEEEVDPMQLASALVARASAQISRAKFLPEGKRKEYYLAAIKDCDEALQVEPRVAAAHFNRGLALRMMDEYPKAADEFTKALELSPNQTEARFRRGIVWFYMEEYGLALGDFLDLNLATADFRAMFWAGLVQAKQGDYVDAVLSYSDAIRENPENVLAHKNRALAYLHLEQYERAIDDLNRVLRSDREDAVSYYRRGVALERLEKYASAITSYEKAIKYNPDFADAHRSLGELYEYLDRPDLAQKHLDMAEQLEPIEL